MRGDQKMLENSPCMGCDKEDDTGERDKEGRGYEGNNSAWARV